MPRRNNDRDKDTKKKELRRISTKKRPCRFCSDKENHIDYKRVGMLGDFINERCKISPRRMTGNCQYHQNRVVEAIKRARHLSMMPYTITHAVRD